MNANQPSTDGFPLWEQAWMPSDGSRAAGSFQNPSLVLCECHHRQSDRYFDLHSRAVLSSWDVLQTNKEKPPASVFYRYKAWKSFINQRGFVQKLPKGVKRMLSVHLCYNIWPIRASKKWPCLLETSGLCVPRQPPCKNEDKITFFFSLFKSQLTFCLSESQPLQSTVIEHSFSFLIHCLELNSWPACGGHTNQLRSTLDHGSQRHGSDPAAVKPQAQLTCLCRDWQSSFRTKILYDKVGISPWLCFIGPSEAITLMQITVALENSYEPLSSLGWCYWKIIKMRKMEPLDMTEPSAKNTATVVSSFFWTAPTGLSGPGFELSNLSAVLS